MVSCIYLPELQLNKANTSDTEAPFFFDLHLSFSNGFVSSKIDDMRDDFDFDIVNFPFLDGSTSYGVYISQFIRFARVSSHVSDFNARNKSLTAKLLQQGYRYHKLRKIFSKFYRRHYELVSKFNVVSSRAVAVGFGRLNWPTRCTPVTLGFKGSEWGSKLGCLDSVTQCVDEKVLGCGLGFFDLVGCNGPC